MADIVADTLYFDVLIIFSHNNTVRYVHILNQVFAVSPALSLSLSHTHTHTHTGLGGVLGQTKGGAAALTQGIIFFTGNFTIWSRKWS